MAKERCFPGSEYSAEQIEWLKAVEAYRRRTGKTALDAREVLALAAGLGYRKPEPSPALPGSATR